MHDCLNHWRCAVHQGNRVNSAESVAGAKRAAAHGQESIFCAAGERPLFATIHGFNAQVQASVALADNPAAVRVGCPDVISHIVLVGLGSINVKHWADRAVVAGNVSVHCLQNAEVIFQIIAGDIQFLSFGAGEQLIKRPLQTVYHISIVVNQQIVHISLAVCLNVDDWVVQIQRDNRAHNFLSAECVKLHFRIYLTGAFDYKVNVVISVRFQICYQNGVLRGAHADVAGFNPFVAAVIGWGYNIPIVRFLHNQFASAALSWHVGQLHFRAVFIAGVDNAGRGHHIVNGAGAVQH